jgi:hypothetical protein
MVPDSCQQQLTECKKALDRVFLFGMFGSLTAGFILMAIQNLLKPKETTQVTTSEDEQ